MENYGVLRNTFRPIVQNCRTNQLNAAVPGSQSHKAKSPVKWAKYRPSNGGRRKGSKRVTQIEKDQGTYATIHQAWVGMTRCSMAGRLKMHDFEGSICATQTRSRGKANALLSWVRCVPSVTITWWLCLMKVAGYW